MEDKNPICGIVMPISAIDGCDKTHWIEVKEIISEAIIMAGFCPHLVSDSEESGVIQKRIVQNLYDNPVAVCDVSGKNPNVMFELGMRLAFDKPTIILKDDSTPYSFDTAAIEHIEYPRSLKYSSINTFKEALSEKIKMTYEAAEKNNNYTTFLKHFGEFTVAKITKKEVSSEVYLLEAIESLSKNISLLNNRVDSLSMPLKNKATYLDNQIKFTGPTKIMTSIKRDDKLSNKILYDKLLSINGVSDVRYYTEKNGMTSIIVTTENNENADETNKKVIDTIRKIESGDILNLV